MFRTGYTIRRLVTRKTKTTHKPNAKYYYKIFPEGTIEGKVWCTTHSKIFQKIMDASPDWQATENLRQVDYTDLSAQSPIKSFFKTNADITTKIFLAKLLQEPDKVIRAPVGALEVIRAPVGALEVIRAPVGALEVIRAPVGAVEVIRAPVGAVEVIRAPVGAVEVISAPTDILKESSDTVPTTTELLNPCAFYPATLICRNGTVNSVNSRNQALWDANERGKWFLKPSKGYGGSGITVVNSPQEAKKYMKRAAAGFPTETLVRDPRRVHQAADYVLQQGIEPYLMEGFKFDIRIWILWVFEKKELTVYLYDDAFLRVSSKLYRADSTNTLINLTNLTYHSDQRSTISKTYTFKSREYYAEVFPQIQQAVTVLVSKLRQHIIPWGKGFEIMGLDFILDQQKRPFLLEINRHIGYPVNAHNKSTVNLVYQMMRDTINLAILGNSNGSNWIQLIQWK